MKQKIIFIGLSQEGKNKFSRIATKAFAIYMFSVLVIATLAVAAANTF